MAVPFPTYLPSPSISNCLWFHGHSLQDQGLYLLTSILPAERYSVCQALQNVCASFGVFQAEPAQIIAAHPKRFYIFDGDG